MAADFFLINRAKPAGAMSIGLAQSIKQIQDTVKSLIAVADHQINGSDFSYMESQFGLSAGQGEAFRTQLGLLDVIFNSTQDLTGAQRKAWLDEYFARVANQ